MTVIIIIIPKININKFQSFNPIFKIIVTIIISIIIIIRIIRTKPVEYPFKEINIIIILIFFLTFIIIKIINKL